MKLNTIVWIKLESKGKPADTIVRQASIRDCILIMADWLNKVYMGSHIVMRLARSEAELNAASTNPDREGMMADLTSLIDGLDSAEGVNGQDGDDNLVPSTPLHCPHGRSLGPCAECRVEHSQATM